MLAGRRRPSSNTLPQHVAVDGQLADKYQQAMKGLRDLGLGIRGAVKLDGLGSERSYLGRIGTAV